MKRNPEIRLSDLVLPGAGVAIAFVGLQAYLKKELPQTAKQKLFAVIEVLAGGLLLGAGFTSKEPPRKSLVPSFIPHERKEPEKVKPRIMFPGRSR